MITASICAIGDEILIGQVIDTNSSHISKVLNLLGIRVTHIHAVGDVPEDITATIDKARSESNLIVMTGGLGPTKDDMTKNLLYAYTGASSYVHVPEQESIIRRICAQRQMPYSGLNATQASVPNTCEVLVNRLGTAPGMWFPLPQTPMGAQAIVSLPGVPFEMQNLMEQVAEKAKHYFRLRPILHKTICTYGIPESALAEQIAGWENRLPPNLHLAYLPDPLLGVRLRLSMYEDGNEKAMEQAFGVLRTQLGEAIYGEGEDTLPHLVARLLLSRGATLSTAESCTGGRIAQLITAQAGASRYYQGGCVAYQNMIKENILGVNPDILATEGAVCKECVEQMAMGAMSRYGSTYALATSGIAGPSGGTDNKPVGTVWMAVAGPSGMVSQCHHFPGSRHVVIDRFAATALNLLRLTILKDKTLFVL